MARLWWIKTTSSWVWEITVKISSAPFCCTLPGFICSLIFWATVMRTWFRDYFFTVCHLFCYPLKLMEVAAGFSVTDVWAWSWQLAWTCTYLTYLCVTLSKCLTELDDFRCLKTKLLCLSSVIFLISILWIGAGMKYIWVCVYKGEEDMSHPDAFWWMPLDLKLLQIITRIMDAEINYGPFEKKTHKKLGIQRMHPRWKPCQKWFLLQLLRICHCIFCGTLCCC